MFSLATDVPDVSTKLRENSWKYREVALKTALAKDCIAVSSELVLERSVDLYKSVLSATCDAGQSDDQRWQTEAVCTE